MAYIFLVLVLHWSWEGGFVNPIHLTPSVGTQYSRQLPQNIVGAPAEKKKQAPFTYLCYTQKKTPKSEDGGDERRILRASAALISTYQLNFVHTMNVLTS